jgi:hypothetical protein
MRAVDGFRTAGSGGRRCATGTTTPMWSCGHRPGERPPLRELARRSGGSCTGRLGCGQPYRDGPGGATAAGETSLRRSSRPSRIGTRLGLPMSHSASFKAWDKALCPATGRYRRSSRSGRCGNGFRRTRGGLTTASPTPSLRATGRRRSRGMQRWCWSCGSFRDGRRVPAPGTPATRGLRWAPRSWGRWRRGRRGGWADDGG